MKFKNILPLSLSVMVSIIFYQLPSASRFELAVYGFSGGVALTLIIWELIGGECDG